MNPAMPRTTKSPTRIRGMARTTSAFFSMKLPSMSGCMRAAKRGSVAANTSIPTMETANIRQ